MSAPELGPTLEILEKLIAFDTTSRNSNLELVSWVEEYLAQYDVQCERVENSEGTKSNLIATAGPNNDGGVILSGHSDVVPVDGQDWSTDPWKLTERGGKFFGRGTCDMKGFIALALAHVPLLVSGKRPVHLAISYDEEVGCQGAPAMIAMLADRYPAPSAAIIGEPSLMQIIDGHKGITVYHVKISGVAAHSSLPHLGVSANMFAIELMAGLKTLAEELAAKGNPENGFEPSHATLTVGVMQGGTAANILAESSSFTFDLRCPPDDDAAVILAPFLGRCERLDNELRKRDPRAGVTVTKLADAPPLTPHGNDEAISLVRRITGSNADTSKVSYAAEAGQFRSAGFPTVICGPGSIEQAHQPNEWIARSELEAGAQFMQRLADELQ